MNNVIADSDDQTVAAVFGANIAGGDGIVGTGGKRGVTGQTRDNPGIGVYGEGGSAGVMGMCDQGDGVVGYSHDSNSSGVHGNNGQGGYGVRGDSPRGTGVHGESQTWAGVHGHSEQGAGVSGVSEAFDGVWGESHGKGFSGVSGRSSHPEDGFGVWGRSEGRDGVWGESHAQGKSGVAGRNFHPQGGFGVWGNSDAGTGVGGFSQTLAGVFGHSEKGAGVSGVSEAFDGVWGESHGQGAGVSGRSEAGDGVWGASFDPDRAGVSGRCLNKDGSVNNDGLAGWFGGKVVVTNDIVLSNADCAEEFDVVQSENTEPGTVMVLSDEGALHPSQEAYDKRVAGVLSGAGNYKPGIVLDKQQSQPNRRPIALLGKVYCKVDASQGPIEVGDLLTTSDRPGHAMKAVDALKAFGSIIGKAMRPLKEGQGLIPILIALQ